MQKNNVCQYRIIRGYNNQCSLEVFVRKLIRHHIDSIYLPDKLQEYLAYKGGNYASKDEN